MKNERNIKNFDITINTRGVSSPMTNSRRSSTVTSRLAKKRIGAICKNSEQVEVTTFGLEREKKKP